jgi:hypothetical protein
VGLAAFAAAAISKGDPIKTGIQGFTYDMRTAILPFMFIFNTQLLMIGIDNIFEFVMVVVSSIIAMLIFAGATQGYWISKNRWYETVALLALTFLLFRPGFIWDKVQPPYEELDGSMIFEVAKNQPKGERLQFVVSGTTIDDIDRTYTFSVDIKEGATGKERLLNSGLMMDTIDGRAEIMMVNPGISKQMEAIKVAGVDSGWIIEKVKVKADRISKQILFIPLFLMIFLIGYVQSKRLKKQTSQKHAI